MRSANTTADRLAEEAASFVRERWDCAAETGLILGTGLGELAEEIEAEASIAYREIPHFPRSTALAHKGVLLCGRLAGMPVIAMQGRSHLYEGYRLDDLMLPVRMLCRLGLKRLIVTNAAGGINPRFVSGDVMLIDDHINLMGRPRGPAVVTDGHRQARFYDESLLQEALAAARRNNFPCQRGVYVGVTGPSYETRAEYRFFRRIGGDCVGMSTIPEVLAAASCGMQVLAISTVTNVARPDAPQVVSAEDVVQVAQSALPKVRQLILGMLRRFGERAAPAPDDCALRVTDSSLVAHRP